MENIKSKKETKRLNLNRVDQDTHISTHIKPGLYALQNHEEHELKTLPINSNTLNFTKRVNKKLISNLYKNKENPLLPSKEFSTNLMFFYVYLTFYLVVTLAISFLLYSADCMP
jgi:hypothetical protein